MVDQKDWNRPIHSLNWAKRSTRQPYKTKVKIFWSIIIISCKRVHISFPNLTPVACHWVEHTQYLLAKWRSKLVRHYIADGLTEGDHLGWNSSGVSALTIGPLFGYCSQQHYYGIQCSTHETITCCTGEAIPERDWCGERVCVYGLLHHCMYRVHSLADLTH